MSFQTFDSMATGTNAGFLGFAPNAGKTGQETPMPPQLFLYGHPDSERSQALMALLRSVKPLVSEEEFGATFRIISVASLKPAEMPQFLRRPGIIYPVVVNMQLQRINEGNGAMEVVRQCLQMLQARATERKARLGLGGAKETQVVKVGKGATVVRYTPQLTTKEAMESLASSAASAQQSGIQGHVTGLIGTLESASNTDDDMILISRKPLSDDNNSMPSTLSNETGNIGDLANQMMQERNAELQRLGVDGA